MGLADDELVNPDVVSQTLRCGICTDVYMDPVFSAGRPCQHVFCRSCIQRALTRKRECPTCRGPMRRTSLKPHQAIASLLDELHVRCSGGCGWTGRKDALPAHLDECPSRLLEAAKAQVLAQSLQIASLQLEVASLSADLRKSKEETHHHEQDARRLRWQVREKDVQIEELRGQVQLEPYGGELARLAHLHAQTAASVAEILGEAQAAAARHAATMETCAKMARREKQVPTTRELQIFVRPLFGGGTRVLKVAANDTIHEIKQKVQEKTEIPPHMFQLKYSGKILHNDNLLALDYAIDRDSTLHMVHCFPSQCRDIELGPATKRRRSGRV